MIYMQYVMLFCFLFRAFQDFFFSHYALFETQLQSLRVKIEKSFYLRQKFLDTAVEAVEAFRKDILRLCYTPRIIVCVNRLLLFALYFIFIHFLICIVIA